MGKGGPKPMSPAQRRARDHLYNVDYSRVATMPVRDMFDDGRIIFFVDVYGWNQNDIAVVPGGSEPAYKAVVRLGLDPNRYQATFWDSDGSGVILGGELFKPVSEMRGEFCKG